MSESGQFLDAKVTLVKWIFTLVSVTHTAEQRETICYKLLPMIGTGWIRVSFTISGHFIFLVLSEKCPEIVLLFFLGS